MEFIEYLKRNFGDRIKGIYLFGSYVSGDYTDESDVDVLIIGDLSLDDILDEVFRILMKHGVLLNVIIEKPEEFERWKDTSFHRTVLSEGIRVY
ncbi:nucleotidyltransferase domain-containing protein [Thermococcus sp.]|uniref:nucleotidyltransferase domain-containing protein n=1 Tax=Thermococcus sp. TaxID=35749 RepID=UPI0026357CAA|nr:nucleotidyltransferase domain-containing protein [Thermococcus sp.]